MSQLVGHVTFSTDTMRGVEHGMLAAAPGAGAGRFWSGRHAVVGLRAARAPAAGRPDRPGLVAALLGRCAAGPGTLTDDPDTVLDACADGPDTLPGSLDGDYALAVWDESRRQLTLVRDALGTRPLYYHRTDDGVVFASCLAALLAHPRVPVRLGLDGLRQALAGIAVPGATPYEGVREVPAGHAVRFGRDGVSWRRHWRPDASAGHTDDLATTVRRTRELLERAVERRTGDGPVAALVSGGLDSSTLAALHARHRSGPITTFAVDYPGYEDGYEPHIARPDPDTPYVRDMVAHLGARHTDVLLKPADLTGGELWETLVGLIEAPTVLADVEPSMLLLYRRVAEASGAVLGGEGADELFGGFPWFHHPQWATAPGFPWAPTTDLVVGTLFGRASAALDVPGFRDQEYRRAVAEFAGDPHTDRMRLVIQLFLTRFLPEQLERAHRFGAATGLDVRTPFCDRALVDYVFAVPWAVHTADGREKTLLRAAARDLLPASVRGRRKSGYPLTRDAAYDHTLRTAVRRLCADPGEPVHPLLDDRAVDAPRLSRNEMELALRLNGWLKRRRLQVPSSIV
ncbi:asparagine synthetase B family protein [Actinoplanes siamensis]|nr:asparagine synthase-related protein [Actinoplanes siamensis]